MFEWWNTLSLATQIFYCIAIPSSLVLLIQTLLTFIGIGGDSDIDADGVDDLGGDIDGDIPQRERSLIRSFVASGRPVLGICRGMQAINVYFGGTLCRYMDGHQAPQGDIVHPTHASGLLRRLLGNAPSVNSNHHQAVVRVGHGLRVVQRAADGTVEALCHNTLPIWGVQWHPERQCGALRRRDAVDAAPIFHHFLAQIK